MPASHGPRPTRQPRAAAPLGRKPHTYRPTFERLEDRLVPVTVVRDLNIETPLELARAIVGNTPVFNVRYAGNTAQAGLLTGGANSYGFDTAVVLSTGRAVALPGPNLNPFLSTNFGGPGDPIMSAFIKGAPTFDTARLSFDFIATGSTLHFRYRFGSDEYTNFIGLFPPPDLFAFFLDGRNIAFIPGTQTLITVDTVNPFVNSQFFVPNPFNPNGPSPIDAELNGLTTIFEVRVPVNPGQRYSLELTIVDGGDPFGDSAVFIEENEGAPLSRAAVQAERPLRWEYNPNTGIYSGDIIITNPSNINLPGPLYIHVTNLPRGVEVVNDDLFRVSGFTNNSTTQVIPVPAGSLPAGANARVPIQLRNPFNEPLGTFYTGFDISLVQL